MKKIVTIVGARPQFIKAAVINRLIREKYSDSLEEVILHTGQHYDDNMSGVFFRELEIDEPKYNLKIGSENHGVQTASMLCGIEKVLLAEKPDIVVVYGDTNSTLSGALAASKLQIPIAHIEAGLRSFNKTMPEEINRILTDHVSTLLFCPTENAIKNLNNEGIVTDIDKRKSIDNPYLLNVGDVMYDSALYFSDKINSSDSDNYILCTIHRENNVMDLGRLESILLALCNIADYYTIEIVLPFHPRTKEVFDKLINSKVRDLVESNKFIKRVTPLSYIEMCKAEASATLIITDSGGVQKEAYFNKKPCVILRKETEWVELLDNGSCKLVDADTNAIISETNTFLSKIDFDYPPLFGVGNAGELIIKELINFAE